MVIRVFLDDILFMNNFSLVYIIRHEVFDLCGSRHLVHQLDQGHTS